MHYWEISVLPAGDILILFKHNHPSEISLRTVWYSKEKDRGQGSSSISMASISFFALMTQISIPRPNLAPELQFCMHDYYQVSFLMFPNHSILHIIKLNSSSLTKPTSFSATSSVDGTLLLSCPGQKPTVILNPSLSHLTHYIRPVKTTDPSFSLSPSTLAQATIISNEDSVSASNWASYTWSYILPTYCPHCSQRESEKTNLIISSLITSVPWLFTEFKFKYKFCTRNY